MGLLASENDAREVRGNFLLLSAHLLHLFPYSLVVADYVLNSSVHQLDLLVSLLQNRGLGNFCLVVHVVGWILVDDFLDDGDGLHDRLTPAQQLEGPGQVHDPEGVAVILLQDVADVLDRGVHGLARDLRGFVLHQLPEDGQPEVGLLRLELADVAHVEAQLGNDLFFSLGDDFLVGDC